MSSDPKGLKVAPPLSEEQDEVTDPNLMAPKRRKIPSPASMEEAKLPPINPIQASAPTTTAAPVRMPEMGALSAFMKDPTVTEIMVNDIRNVMIEKDGKLVFSGLALSTIEELNRLVRNILDITGRVLSADQPYLDLMLPDGSRVNIVAPPLTQHGPCLTIRKFPTRRLGIEDLLQTGMFDKRMAHFLNACVLGRMNILISGGTGSGKTSLLNALVQLVPKGERIVAIEDTPELVINHSNSVRMQTKARTPTTAPVTARDLVANSLRMRPDRIIVGECRRAEAFDMLQAMNTGHSGSMTTVHANAPRDALSRIETLCMTAGLDLPILAVRKQINSAIDLLIQIKRFRSGKRRITSITEVTGIEGDTITLQEIFNYETDPKNPQNNDAGHFVCTGFVPTFLDRLADQGIELARNFFA
jgi:Flp pilus assembly CpaF family ATPase